MRFIALCLACVSAILAGVVGMVAMVGAFKFKAMNPVRGPLVLAQFATIAVMVVGLIQGASSAGACISGK